jgi:hypothetical protein
MMTTRDTNEIRELARAELDLVTGGSIAKDITTAVLVLSDAAFSIMIFGSVACEVTGYNPDPWG